MPLSYIALWFYFSLFNLNNINFHSITIIFSVLVPPHQILVYDASGRDVAGTVGPLLEGDSLVVTCEVRGGK